MLKKPNNLNTQLKEMVLLQININTLHRNACLVIMRSEGKENF